MSVKSGTGVRVETDARRGASESTLSRLRKLIGRVWVDVAAFAVIFIVFVVPFIFIFLTAAKPRGEAALFEFSWPTRFSCSKTFGLWSRMVITGCCWRCGIAFC